MADADACELFYYQTRTGQCPFAVWVDRISDPIAASAVQDRLARLRLGLFGDCKPVGNGVFELRIDVGAGYRAYIARTGGRVILLLCGGDKRTQDRDIRLAKEYWSDYGQRIRSAGDTG